MSGPTVQWDVRIRRWLSEAGTHLFCGAVALTCLFPLGWMVSSSLKTQATVFSNLRLIPPQPQWQNYVLAWTQGHFGSYFWNSVRYTICVVGGVVLVASMAAYAFARLQFRGKELLYTLLLATMFIPIPGSFIAIYVLLTKLHLINTQLGYILPQINGSLALGIFILRPFFEGIPRELEESAKIDGCGRVGIFRHIMLPLARPALSVVVIMTSLAVWNEYLLALLIFSSQELMPLQRGLMVFQGAHLTQYPLLMAGMIITIVPIVAVYLAMQQHIVKGVTAGAVKG